MNFNQDTNDGLQQAIRKMSCILKRKKSVDQKVCKIEEEKVEEYIRVLSEKYNKIRKILSEENQGLEVEYSRNEALKGKLVKEQEDKEENLKEIER